MICNRVAECFSLFDEYIDSSAGDSSKQENILRAREQAARLRLWASNIGVFARYQASLDYRLRDAPDVAEIICDMLGVLNNRIKHVLNPTSEYALDIHNLEAKETVTRKIYTLDTEQRRHDELERLADSIGRLQRISLAIREASSRSAISRASSIQDTIDGESFEVDFLGYVEHVLECRVRKASPALRKHLAFVIYTRRQRFVYTQKHQRKLRYNSIARDTNVSGLSGAIRDGSRAELTETIEMSKPLDGNRSFQSGTIASTFEQSHFVMDMTPTVASSQLSSSPITFANSEIPPAPTLEGESSEHECPYCCWLLPAKVFNSPRRWRKHIEQDLQPYICLFESCFELLTAFSSMNTWVTHINDQHSWEWTCPLRHRSSEPLCLSGPELTKGEQAVGKTSLDRVPDVTPDVNFQRPQPSPYKFTTKEDMETHLEQNHPQLSRSQIRTSIQRSKHQCVEDIFQECPFCSWLPQQGTMEKPEAAGNTDKMQGHIANHLLTLSLMSLPWRGDIESDDESRVSGPIHSQCSWSTEADNSMKEDQIATASSADSDATRSQSPIENSIERIPLTTEPDHFVSAPSGQGMVRSTMPSDGNTPEAGSFGEENSTNRIPGTEEQTAQGVDGFREPHSAGFVKSSPRSWCKWYWYPEHACYVRSRKTTSGGDLEWEYSQDKPTSERSPPQKEYTPRNRETDPSANVIHESYDGVFDMAGHFKIASLEDPASSGSRSKQKKSSRSPLVEPPGSKTPIVEFSGSPFTPIVTRNKSDIAAEGSQYASQNPNLNSDGGSRDNTPQPGNNIHKNIPTLQPRQSKETLNPEFQVHHSSFFKPGQVFKVLWAEPEGNTASSSATAVTDYTLQTKFDGENVHASIRRFIIVAADQGHCQCLPILTYGHYATLKNGVKAEDHAIVHMDDPVPDPLPGESLSLKPIKLRAKTPRHKLEPQSRINYAKIYTVEYNVKVLFIGEISKSSRRMFMTNFDQVWDKKRKITY